MSSKLSIDIVSDVVCPWCLIGKRRLEIALQRLRADRPEIEPVIRWLPYFLNPDIPEEGEPYRPFLERRFGGPEKVAEFLGHVVEAGKTVGIDFAFDRIEVCPNTRRAHRLIHRMQQQGDADALVERLFSAHLQRGEKVGSLDELVRIAAECGLNEADARAYLNSDEGNDAVNREAFWHQQIGINIVPFFIFNGRPGIGGAQPPDILLGAIRRGMGIST